jgi:hypothetical protein
MTPKADSLPSKVERPDYVVCVGRSHIDHKNETWCERRADGFVFAGIDHAAENGKAGGRLVACPQCVEQIGIALAFGNEPQ